MGMGRRGFERKVGAGLSRVRRGSEGRAQESPVGAGRRARLGLAAWATIEKRARRAGPWATYGGLVVARAIEMLCRVLVRTCLAVQRCALGCYTTCVVVPAV